MVTPEHSLFAHTIHEPPYDKTNKMTCASCEDSDQPGHPPPSLIRVFDVRTKKRWALKYLSTGWRQHQMSRLMTKPTKWHVRPAKIQISLGIRPVWSESSLSARRKIGSLATHWAHSEDSDQTGRMPRLIWVVDGRTGILLVLSWGGSDTFYPAGDVTRVFSILPGK